MDAISHYANHTIDDIYALPDGQRAELIDGNIYYMAPPVTKHQRLVGNIYNKISNFIQDNHGTCEPFVAPFGVFFNNDNKNYLEPDICVICDPNKITDKGCNGAPDWIIEIVSPASRQMDYYTKLFKYLNLGVREYWIVDPDKQRIMVYNFEKEWNEEYSFGEDVPIGIYEGFSINVS